MNHWWSNPAVWAIPVGFAAVLSVLLSLVSRLPSERHDARIIACITVPAFTALLLSILGVGGWWLAVGSVASLLAMIIIAIRFSNHQPMCPARQLTSV
jgi:hypothetical protein